MKSISRKVSFIVPALALIGLVGVSAPAPVAAQSIFASPMAAHAAGVGYSAGGGYRANATTPAGSGSGYSANDTTTDPGTDPYTGIFAQIQTATSSLLSGPGALAFGVLILGLGFGVAWRLVTKGVKSISK